MNNTTYFSWSTLEYEYKKKKADWYWVAIILIIIGIVFSFIINNVLLAFLIFIAGILIIMFSLKKPNTLLVKINERGIQINKQLFPYRNIKLFSIIQNNGGINKLLLHVDNRMNPIVSLNTANNIDVYDLHDFLLNFIEEGNLEESISDHIAGRI